MQLLDELPMVWGGCILAYCMFEVQSPPCSKLSAAQGRGPNNKPLALILTLLATVFTLTHIYMKIPILHFITYGIIVICKSFIMLPRMRCFQCPTFVALATLDVQIMKSQYSRQLLCFYGLGLLLQLVAGLLWLIDNMVCEQLEATRQLGIIPTWLSPLTQLHGWWHVLAGYATYMHIIFCICHRQVYLKRACFLQPHYIFGYIIQRSADADSIEPWKLRSFSKQSCCLGATFAYQNTTKMAFF